MKRRQILMVVSLVLGAAVGLWAQSSVVVDGSGSRLELRNNAELHLSGSAGTADQLLVSQGSGATPTWKSLSGATGEITITPSPAALTVGLATIPGLVPTTYGSPTHVPQITVDDKGRIILVTNIPIIGVPPGGPAGGDLDGNYPNPTVAKIRGTQIDPGLSPTLGDVLRWNGSAWTAAPPSPAPVVTQYPIVGDGSSGDPIRFANGTAADQVWMWNGGAWVLQDRCSGCTNLSVINDITAGGNIAAGGDVNVGGNLLLGGDLQVGNGAGTPGQVLVSQGPGVQPEWWDIVDDGTTTTVSIGGGQIQIAANNTSPIWNADQLRNTQIDPGLSPTLGDVLTWNGSQWTAAPPSPAPVVTQYPIVGDGSSGDPIRFANGTAADQVWMWNGGAWVLQDRCSGCTNLSVINDITAGGNIAAGGDVNVGGNLLLGGDLQVGNGAGTPGQVLVSQGPGVQPEWWDIVDDGTTTTVSIGGGQIQIAANNTSPIWNADQLRNTQIDPGLSPTLGDVLTWNGSQWTAAPPSPAPVVTQYPIVGDGSSGDPIRFANGTAADQVWMWNGGAWVLQDRCSGCTNLSVINDITAGGNIAAGGDVNVGGNLLLGGDLQVGNGAGTPGQVLVSQGPGVQPEWWDIVDDGTTTTVSIGGGQIQIAANNTSPIWNADQLRNTQIDPGLSPTTSGQVLMWDGSQWTAAGIGAAGGWLVGGNDLTAYGSDGPLGTTSNHAVIFITNNTEAMRLTTDQRLDFQGGAGVYRIDLPNNSNIAIGLIRANGYATYSSLRWKEDIRPIPNALEKALALRGVNFRWKPEYGGREDIGFVMEEVDRVVPEVVHRDERTGELLGMDYSRLTALLVEALKQHVRTQEQVNARLQQENAELRQRVERLESLVEQLLRQNGERGTGSQPSTIQDAWLGQNIPNPFAGTTTIPYYIPAGVSRAELVVRDVGGRELKRLELAERGAHGQVVLEMGLLGSGTYEYALVLDGRVVAVKQMTLMR
jgi:uncharacterized membrane protein